MDSEGPNSTSVSSPIPCHEVSSSKVAHLASQPEETPDVANAKQSDSDSDSSTATVTPRVIAPLPHRKATPLVLEAPRETEFVQNDEVPELNQGTESVVNTSASAPVASSSGSSSSTLRVITPLQDGFRRHSQFFFSDGNLVIEAGGVLFNVHRSLLARKYGFFETMLNIPPPIDPKDVDGTLEIPLASGHTEEEMRLLLLFVYGGPDLAMDKIKFDSSNIIDIYHLADKFQYPAALKWAREKIQYSSIIKPGHKLAAGLRFREREWVLKGVTHLFRKGSLDLNPEQLQLLDKSHLLALTKSSTIMQQVTTELLLTCPLHNRSQSPATAADSDQWAHTVLCKDHNRCISSIKKTWSRLHLKTAEVGVGSKGMALTDFGELLEKFKFSGVNPGCREAFIKEVQEIATTFHGRLLDATTDYLLRVC